jgi:hypothetical protein
MDLAVKIADKVTEHLYWNEALGRIANLCVLRKNYYKAIRIIEKLPRNHERDPYLLEIVSSLIRKGVEWQLAINACVKICDENYRKWALLGLIKKLEKNQVTDKKIWKGLYPLIGDFLYDPAKDSVIAAILKGMCSNKIWDLAADLIKGIDPESNLRDKACDCMEEKMREAGLAPDRIKTTILFLRTKRGAKGDRGNPFRSFLADFFDLSGFRSDLIMASLALQSFIGKRPDYEKHADRHFFEGALNEAIKIPKPYRQIPALVYVLDKISIYGAPDEKRMLKPLLEYCHKRSREIEDSFFKAKALANTAQLLVKVEKSDQGLQLFDDSLRLARGIEDKREKANLFFSISLQYLKADRLDQSQRVFWQLLDNKYAPLSDKDKNNFYLVYLKHLFMDGKEPEGMRILVSYLEFLNNSNKDIRSCIYKLEQLIDVLYEKNINLGLPSQLIFTAALNKIYLKDRHRGDLLKIAMKHIKSLGFLGDALDVMIKKIAKKDHDTFLDVCRVLLYTEMQPRVFKSILPQIRKIKTILKNNKTFTTYFIDFLLRAGKIKEAFVLLDQVITCYPDKVEKDMAMERKELISLKKEYLQQENFKKIKKMLKKRVSERLKGYSLNIAVPIEKWETEIRKKFEINIDIFSRLMELNGSAQNKGLEQFKQFMRWFAGLSTTVKASGFLLIISRLKDAPVVNEDILQVLLETMEKSGCYSDDYFRMFSKLTDAMQKLKIKDKLLWDKAFNFILLKVDNPFFKDSLEVFFFRHPIHLMEGYVKRVEESSRQVRFRCVLALVSRAILEKNVNLCYQALILSTDIYEGIRYIKLALKLIENSCY